MLALRGRFFSASADALLRRSRALVDVSGLVSSGLVFPMAPLIPPAIAFTFTGGLIAVQVELARLTIVSAVASSFTPFPLTRSKATAIASWSLA
jgi:hypothetical protein